MLNKIILPKPGLSMNLKIPHISIQPNRFPKVKIIAHLLQGLKHHLRAAQTVIPYNEAEREALLKRL